jgi:polygalacturonase
MNSCIAMNRPLPTAVFLVGLYITITFAALASSPPPSLPKIAAKTFNVTQFGAIGDGKTLNTAALQKTIDTAAAAGGGVVLVPEGKFLTEPFTLASRINLQLARGAIILISDDLKSYPSKAGRYRDSITATDAQDVEISGQGTIDGQGQVWWATFRTNRLMTHRPYMIKLQNCQRVWVHGLTLCNSPMFHLVPQNCTDVTIEEMTIRAPGNAPNTDGIDPSGWNFLIRNCTIDTGDDNIAVKPTGPRNPGNKNYLITNCTFLRGHGMSIGSGTSGGIEALQVMDCRFDSTDSGIRIKTARGRGGLLQNLLYENLTMKSVKNPIYIVDWYPEREAPKDPATETAQPITERTPINQNIVIRNVTATDCPTAGTIRGLPEMPISNVTLDNVSISATNGMKIYHAKGIRFLNSKVAVAKGDRLALFNAEVQGLD